MVATSTVLSTTFWRVENLGPFKHDRKEAKKKRRVLFLFFRLKISEGCGSVVRTLDASSSSSRYYNTIRKTVEHIWQTVWSGEDQYQTVFSSKCQCWRRECVLRPMGIDWLNRTNKPAEPRRHFFTKSPPSFPYTAQSVELFLMILKRHTSYFELDSYWYLFYFFRVSGMASSCARVMNYRRNVHKRSGWTLWPHEHHTMKKDRKRKRKKKGYWSHSARKVSE